MSHSASFLSTDCEVYEGCVAVVRLCECGCFWAVVSDESYSGRCVGVATECDVLSECFLSAVLDYVSDKCYTASASSAGGA